MGREIKKSFLTYGEEEWKYILWVRVIDNSKRSLF